MDRKKQLVEQCIAASNPPDDDMRNRTRLYFEAFTEEDLEKEFSALIGQMDLDEQKEATRRERVKLQIFQTSGLANVPLNDAELDRQLPGGLLTLETFASLIKNEAIKNKFAWQTQPFTAAKRVRAERTEADRENFLTAARELVVSPDEANFSLVVGALGSGFSSYSVKAAVASGQIQLAQLMRKRWRSTTKMLSTLTTQCSGVLQPKGM